MAFFPVALLIALLRVHLFDVDRLLSGAAVYTLVLVVGAVASETILEPFLAAVSARVGFDPDTGQLLLLAALTAALVPVNRRLGPRVERWFFEDRAARLAGLSGLAERLAGGRGGGGPEQAAREIDRLYEPRATAAYERSGDALRRAWARGGDFPDALCTGSVLVDALAGRATPLRLTGTTGAIGAASLDGGLAVPVLDSSGLGAVLLLGPRRSGDVYTPTDTALLATVASALAFGSRAV
jgi:hypothetical protein